MKMSTKGRYASRIMLYIAIHETDKPIKKQDIAISENISQDYVEQILTMLKSAGLVHSYRGAKGGFMLARSPEKISLNDIICATEGPLKIVPCDDGKGNCNRAVFCAMRPIWIKANYVLADFFSGITLDKLVTEAKELLDSHIHMYEI